MIASTALRRRLFWTLQIGGWVALIPPFIMMSYLFIVTPAAAVFFGVFRQVVGFFLTLGLAAIYRTWNWDRFSLWRHGTLAVVLCLTAMCIDMTLTDAVRQVVEINFGAIPSRALQIGTGIGRSCIYVAWSALYLSLRFFFELRERDLRLAQVEIEARDAELHVLRAQLNPHFLFNALNSILAEAEDNPSQVTAITLNLSELLRFSLRQREHFGPLAVELAAIENYLRVEHSRFRERLDWRIEASDDAREAVVPSALLLPLVENAIKYGLQTSSHRLILSVRAELCDGSLNAFVENSGHWVEPGSTTSRSTGIGLPNLRRRLALLSGPAAQVEISHPPGFVRVMLRVPLVTVPV